MTYYVYGIDGQKYGPTTVENLNVWVTENRLNPDTILEEAETGQKRTASTILQFPIAGQLNAEVAYPRIGNAQVPRNSMPAGFYSLIYGSIGLLMAFLTNSIIGFIFCVVAIYHATKSIRQGNGRIGWLSMAIAVVAGCIIIIRFILVVIAMNRI